MDLKLSDKTAYISGSTSGIGFAVAKGLLQEGASVVLNGRTQDGINKAIAKLKGEVPQGLVSGLAADFNSTDEVASLLQQLPNIDILINNVGIYRSESFFETPNEDWHQQFMVNVMSGVRLSKHCMPKMLDKNWGRIIFVSSECATLVPSDLLAYSTSKAALLSLSRGLAQMTKGSNVTVNSVLPGSTLSEGAERFLQEMALKENKTNEQIETDFFTNVRPSSLLQRFATVEEIANTIIYFSSPLSSATNGAVVKIDGGSTGGIL